MIAIAIAIAAVSGGHRYKCVPGFSSRSVLTKYEAKNLINIRSIYK